MTAGPARRSQAPRPPSEPLLTRRLRRAGVTGLTGGAARFVFEWQRGRGGSLPAAGTATVNMRVIGEIVSLGNGEAVNESAARAASGGCGFAAVLLWPAPLLAATPRPWRRFLRRLGRRCVWPARPAAWSRKRRRFLRRLGRRCVARSLAGSALTASRITRTVAARPRARRPATRSPGSSDRIALATVAPALPLRPICVPTPPFASAAIAAPAPAEFLAAAAARAVPRRLALVRR